MPKLTPKEVPKAVVHEELCTGCELCIPPCPVDCIEMVEAKSRWTPSHKAAAKARALQRKERLRTNQFESASSKDARAVIEAALARKRRR